MAKAKKSPKRAAKTAKRRKATEKEAPAKLTAQDLKVTVTDAERAGWKEAAAVLKDADVGIGVPYAVLMGESVDVAKFARGRWAPELHEKTKAVVVPGLSSAVRGDLKVTPFAPVPVLHEGTAQEILVLHALTQEAQTRALLSATSSGGAVHPRFEGEATLSNLRGAAESYLDDGVETDEDARLRAVNDAHANDPGTDDALAGALDDYAALTESLLPGIEGYADFKPEWITRARELAAELRVAPAAPAPRADRSLLDARDRLATLLLRRMGIVRAKARFVFRDHAAVVREATSVYERRRRSAHKRAKKAAAKPSTA